MDLKYKTNEMGDPQGKPKVYFACHPDDFAGAFPLLSDDILEISDCAVWYDPDPSQMPGSEEEQREFEEIMGDMQLFVFAVTTTFLEKENRARSLELPFAIERHIPILPIMLESGLGYKFSDTCAKIQVVTRYVTDPTATPYKDVLKTFLNAVLIGDEQARKVRAAFDAYVFLSYRKKDRKYAQRLMRLIHDNEDYRDIAIWYDEYLVPGEGFNEAIEDAFKKSSLFAMAVTPHLEEKGNYVMRVEYPMAMDRKEDDKRFEVIPVEMYDKDRQDWRIDEKNLEGHEEFKYTKIDDLRNEYLKDEMNRAFIDALDRIAKKENDGSADHRFFIGLAYLCGIDVEVNRERGLKLIRSAAEDPKPCTEATAKLADMYRDGDGVAVDPLGAVFWQEKLAGQYRQEYEKHHDPDEHKGYGTKYFKALRKLSTLKEEAGDVKGAISAAEGALAFSGELEQEVGIREQTRDIALIRGRLGALYMKGRDYAKAEQCFDMACRTYEKLAAEIGTARARRDLSISYERLGDLYRKRGDLKKSREYYERTILIRQQLSAEAPYSHTARRDYSYVLTKLGNVYKSAKDYARAQNYYLKALDMDRILAKEVKTPQAKDDYAVSLVKVGDIYAKTGEPERAAECYEEACLLFEENLEKTGAMHYRDHRAAGCEKLASAKKKLGDREEAKRQYEKAAVLREKLYETEKTVSAAHALAVTYYNLAGVSDDREIPRKAWQIWCRLCEKDPEFKTYKEMAEKRLRD